MGSDVQRPLLRYAQIRPSGIHPVGSDVHHRAFHASPPSFAWLREQEVGIWNAQRRCTVPRFDRSEEVTCVKYLWRFWLGANGGRGLATSEEEGKSIARGDIGLRERRKNDHSRVLGSCWRTLGIEKWGGMSPIKISKNQRRLCWRLCYRSCNE